MARFRGTLDSLDGHSCARLSDDGLTAVAGGWQARILVRVFICPETGRDKYEVMLAEGHRGSKVQHTLSVGYLDGLS